MFRLKPLAAYRSRLSRRAARITPVPNSSLASSARERGSDADWAMVSLTKWIVVFTIVTGLTAIGSLLFAGWQLQVSREAIDLSKESAVDNGRQTAAALAISDRVASATEKQVDRSDKALGLTSRIASSNERAANIYDADLRLKRSTDIDVGDTVEGLTADGWTTMFTLKLIGGIPIKNAKVSIWAGHSRPDQIEMIWKDMPAPQLFDIAPGADHTFYAHAVRFPGDVQMLNSGRIVMITAIKVTFVDGNGASVERRGCVYFAAGNIPRSCDQN